MQRLNSHDNLYTNLLYHKLRRLRELSRSRQAAYSTVSLRLCFATVSCLMGSHQKEGEDMSIAQFKPKMREVRLDTEVFEERFTDYDIISEFSGIILTLVAVEDNVRYTSFVTASYAEVLRKQKEAIA